MPLFLLPYLKWIKIAGWVILALTLWYAKYRYDDTQREIGRAEIRKELQPKLDKANSDLRALTSLVGVQNSAIENLGRETKEAQEKALQALKGAKLIYQATENNKTRYRAFTLSPEASSCEVQMDDVKKLLESAR